MTVIPQNYKGSSKRERVEDMFDRIAPKYDLLNKVLSVGIDKGWRKKITRYPDEPTINAEGKLIREWDNKGKILVDNEPDSNKKPGQKKALKPKK